MESKVKFEISTATILKVIGIILGIWLLYAIREVVVIFFIVLVIVAAFGPLVDRMSKYIPRVLALIILTLIFFGFLTVIGFLIVPPVVEQLQQLAINAPLYIERFGPLYQNLQNYVLRYQETLLNFTPNFGKLTGGIYSTTIGFISGLVAVVTILVLSFYMLLEQESIKGFLHQTIPMEHKEKIFDVFRKIGNKMGSWLRGQFSLMLLIGILDGIVLAILGVPYALTLAVWGGLTEVIPYIGPWLGMIPAVVIAFTISPIKGLLVLLAYIAVQQLEAQFFAPKIMGKAVGLSPVIIILSLLAGAKLMGILGVIIAVPVAAALAVIAQEWPNLKKMLNS